MLKSSKHISGWCDKHVKSIVYQMLCGLLYMQVLFFSPLLFQPLECEPHSPRPQALQHSPRRQLQRQNHRLRPRSANRLLRSHPPTTQLHGLGSPRAYAGAPIDAARRHALVPRPRAHHATKPLQRVDRHVVRRLHHGVSSPRDSSRRNCCRRWRRTR